MTLQTGSKPTLLNEREVALVTGMSVASVRRWRLDDRGPRFLKIGASVRYRESDVTAWLDTRPSGGNVVEENNRG